MPATISITRPHPDAARQDDRDLLVQSWYPLARSADVRRGHSVSLDVMGHSVVLFRSLANEPGVIKRNCCHMGGDLSRGDVTRNGIRCPIHGWEFAVNGKRLCDIGSGDERSGACQPSLPCTERHGIIFAFFGSDVLFDLPEPEESVFLAPVHVRDFDARYDVPTIFGFDSEHFDTVHNRGIDSMELYSKGANHLGTRIRATVDGTHLRDRIMRAIGLDTIDTDIDFWAANLMLGHHKRSNTYAFLASLPLGDHKLRMFVAVMQRRPSGGVLRQWLGRLQFLFVQPVVMGFVSQDEKALKGVRFDPERCWLSDNPGVQRWLAHFRTLPKIEAAKIFDAE